MKTKLFLLFLFLTLISVAQNNRSAGTVLTTFTGANPAQQFSGGEIFRFQPGVVTQQDDLSNPNFGFTSSRWFALGRVPAGTQTFYGLRFQLPNRGLVMGYSNLTSVNPVIQWIGTAANLGNLEFRVASAFGAPGVPAPDLLVATMKNDGQTIFGASTSAFNSPAKIRVLNEVTIGSGYSGGLSADVSGTQFSDAIVGIARNGIQSNTGVSGITLGTGAFEAGIYGEAQSIGSNQWAGYFNGDVFSNGGTFQTSDEKLKSNIEPEKNILDKLSQLNPVIYNYKKISELNLPQGLQHGFIAQELEAIFPELTRNIKTPIFNTERKFVSNYEFKSVNYIGMIPILTAAIQELNEETNALKAEIAALKAVDKSEKNNLSKPLIEGYKLEQNVPNPFQNQTQIKYEIPNLISNASIVVFDLNGKLIKEYALNSKSGFIIIKSSDIGKGLFLYSLISNGSEIITKKMVVK